MQVPQLDVPTPTTYPAFSRREEEMVRLDPRFVEIELLGATYGFWYCDLGRQIAKNTHGYDSGDVDTDSDQVEEMIRLLWVMHLPFNPSLAFEDFAHPFRVVGFADLPRLRDDIVHKQLGSLLGKLMGGKGEEEEEEDLPPTPWTVLPSVASDSSQENTG